MTFERPRQECISETKKTPFHSSQNYCGWLEVEIDSFDKYGATLSF